MSKENTIYEKKTPWNIRRVSLTTNVPFNENINSSCLGSMEVGIWERPDPKKKRKICNNEKWTDLPFDLSIVSMDVLTK